MKGKKTKRKMGTLAVLGTLSVVMLVVLGGLAMAANPEDVTVTAPVAPTLRLSMSKTDVDFGGGDLNPEVGSYSDSLTATVSSNILWQLQVTKDGDLTGTVDPANVIPSDQLTFGSSSSDGRVTDTQSAGTEFGTDTMVVEGNRGGNIDLTIDYALQINWEDAPDTYQATHTYTVVSQ